MGLRISGRVRSLVRAARWKVESVLASMFALAALVTAVFPRWIEALGLEPDGGDGSAEWGVVALLAVAAVITAALSRRHYASLVAARLAGEEARP